MEHHGTQVRIQIAEPWDMAGTEIVGTLVKDLEGPDQQSYWLVKLLAPIGARPDVGAILLTNRYAGSFQDKLHKEQKVYVDIAAVLDDDLYHQDRFTFDQVDYFAIGSARAIR